ncbi:SWIM zinc finger family protein [Haloarcula marismortui]|uniref:SWIM zinc finger family protein n=1 Tax=Haloarcula marismortui ATCC 33800 TaxID=662476 RepID=A0A8T8KLY4_9EURY|nr:SWIM zinc finger family protein [Haloarcula sinaiiensis]QUJ74887.1 SWIM zinc finger family protein [Haloarcula sinaiiensis ATCC 33800]
MEYPTREAIRSLCTEQSFERGRNYYRQDRVQEVEIDGGEIRATVRGSNYYDVDIDIGDDTIRTHCSCPYDHAGDCKHIVAVLLAVDDRDINTVRETDPESSEPLPATGDLESLVEQITADDLREFLLDILADDSDLRDRFVAFVGEDTGKTVYDYKQELDRLFDDAASRRGMVEHQTHIDFSQYVDLAETHRERGHIETATDIYRAIAEAIRENMNRIDGGTGYYGREMEQAIEAYAETVTEHDLSHERKRPHIEYLCDAFLGADHGFASDSYDDALRTLCTAEADLEYWLQLLDERISGISFDGVATGDSSETENGGDDSSEDTSSDDLTARPERTDNVLCTSDFTDGPLTTDDFTGGALDIEHLEVGTLEFDYFVGDAFEELRIDEPTTVEKHTVDVEPTDSGTAETRISESLRTRGVLSAYIYLLKQLDSEDALTNLYDDIYLEHTRFCKQYAQQLIDEGEQDRAIEVIEDGIRTFRSPRDLRWLAADLHKDRDPEKYRKTLKRLFLDHTAWDAYDELKSTCSEQEWESLYEEFEQHFERDDRKNLVKLYVHDDDLEKAFAELKDSEDLALVRKYRDSVATVDPVEYFELYRELLVPFAANDTGRRHYREIADHLEEMQGFVPQERFEEFIQFLKEMPC